MFVPINHCGRSKSLVVCNQDQRGRGVDQLGAAQKRIATQNVIIQDLQSDLSQVQEVATHTRDQLGRALYVHDDTWSHGYLKASRGCTIMSS